MVDSMDVDKNVRLTKGYVLSLLLIGVPSIAWIFGFEFGDRDPIEISATIIAKTAAFGGMAMFAWSLILSGRYKLFDTLFHGLDKVYIAHRFFGTASLALLLSHPIALTIARLPDRGFDAFGIWTAFGSTALVLAMVSLYGLILVVVWSIIAKVKHETFIAIHTWLGLFFIAGALHAFMAGSVLATNELLRWYMIALSSLATLTFIHYSLLKDVLHGYYKYKVTSVKKIPGNMVDIQLMPKYRILKFQPGQFVYLRFDTIDETYHPFTISSGTRTSELRFIIKELGDYTSQLTRLKHGDKARVKGPYGGFTFRDSPHDKQLWIAGGIGITPFLSKANSLQHSKMWPEIELLYFVKKKSEAVGELELNHISKNHKSFHYSVIDEKKFGMQSLHDVLEHFSVLHDVGIYICGPPPMLRAYKQQARDLGLEDQFFFEEFSY